MNGLIGTVVLNTSNIAETTDKRYMSDAQETKLDALPGLTNTGIKYLRDDGTWQIVSSSSFLQTQIFF